MKSLLFLLSICSSLCASIDMPEEDESLFEPLSELYTVAADTYLSPEIGSINLLTAFRLYEAVDTPWVKGYLSPLESFWGVGARLMDVLFIDFPIAETTMVIQHEVFGHGACLRKEGIGASYKIETPFPYGKGGGATSFSAQRFYELPLYQQNLVTTGGVSATYKLSTDLALYRLRRGGCFAVQDAMLHLVTARDLTVYAIWLRTDASFLDEGNDMADYVDLLNSYYDKKVLSRSGLKARALLNYLDPLLWNDYETLLAYIWDGRVCRSPLKISYGPFSWIPTVRIWLAPYGIEYGTASFIGYGPTWSLVTIKGGSTAGHSSFSIGVESPYLFRNGRWIFGGKADLWIQPSLELRGNDAHARFGGRGAVTIGYLLDNPFVVWGDLSVKSRGYVPAEVGQANLNISLGLTYRAW